MAELSLRERLQPALLDRLIDDERLLTFYEFTPRAEEMQRHGVTERELVDALRSQGLRPAESTNAATLKFTAPLGRMTLAPIKKVPPQILCEISVTSVPNRTVETLERKSITPRKLREYVCRDLATLLNSASLDQTLDLTRYPHVRQSVLNFGMTSMAGRAAYSVEPQKIALSIEDVIRRFEPRLSSVRVTSETESGGADTHVLSFRIEAELWGQPVPQHLVLRTSIEMHSGDVSVADTVGK